MKVLYLHGLDSPLSDEKKMVLANFGEVESPALDYRSDRKIINNLIEAYAGKGYEAIIGSSMGGFAGFYVAANLQIPCLLFNPALTGGIVYQETPADCRPFSPYLYIVLGAKDDVVPCSGTLNWITENKVFDVSCDVLTRSDLAHRIPLNVFEEELTRFMEKIGR